jgi:hypothetical protein
MYRVNVRIPTSRIENVKFTSVKGRTSAKWLPDNWTRQGTTVS